MSYSSGKSLKPLSLELVTLPAVLPQTSNKICFIYLSNICFNQLLGACSTQKLVKIHNTETFLNNYDVRDRKPKLSVTFSDRFGCRNTVKMRGK